MIVSVTLGFMHFAFIRQSEGFQKNRLLWLILCSKSGSYLCVCVPKFVCYLMLVCLCMCCCLSIHIYQCLHIYGHASCNDM